ncbi:hypothetical protein ACH5RR_029888 [Cinchona calisaya]|uniref:Transmembrane protein n=1 Tax=Cinchona calisaya TaxID=153742 RepID=A0ABD2YW94_9GENT
MVAEDSWFGMGFGCGGIAGTGGVADFVVAKLGGKYLGKLEKKKYLVRVRLLKCHGNPLRCIWWRNKVFNSMYSCNMSKLVTKLALNAWCLIDIGWGMPMRLLTEYGVRLISVGGWTPRLSGPTVIVAAHIIIGVGPLGYSDYN